MSFEIKEIKIKLYTNLKNKDLRLIDFDLDMLYNEMKGEATKDKDGGAEKPSVVLLDKSGLNKLPYFTMSVRYPLARLQKDLLTYQERVNFFFDEKKFERQLFLFTDKPEESTDPDINNSIAEHNVMVMLEILFPTKFTVINNAHTSYDHVMGKSSLSRMIINPSIKKYFSYLKLSDGKIYTITRTYWLNDLLNHPLYRTFINEFHTFSLWYTKEKDKLTKQMDKNVESISKTVDDILENIYRGIKQSFTYYNVQPKYDDTAFDINTKPVVRLISMMMRFKSLLDKLKRTRIIDKDEMFKNAGFKQMDDDNGGSDSYFIDELNKAIDETSKRLEEEEEIERKAKKEEGSDKPAKKMENNESEYEDLDDIYVKISDYIQKHFTAESIKNIMLARFINELDKNGKKKNEKTQKTPDRVMPILKSISSSLKEIAINPMKLPVSKFNNLRLYVTKPMDIVQDDLKTIAPEYATFIRNVRSRYYGTQRKSINTYLQNLIDGADEKSVREFFKIFNIIYSKYLSTEPVKTDLELATQLSKVLNTSIAKINTNVANWQYEIYVMTDCIQGKVDDENSSKIFCPYVGEYLGVMFEFLFQSALYGKSGDSDIYRWAVDRNRVYFSIESIKLKNGEVQQQLEQKPLNISVLAQKSDGENKTQKFSSDVIYNAENENSAPVDEDRVNSLFMQNVISSNKNITGDNGILTRLKQYLADIDESRILSYISKNNKPLYGIIVKWHKKEYTRDESLLEEMLALQPSYSGKNAIINKRLTDPQIILDSNERIRLKTEYELNSLYGVVLEKLIELEQKKAIDMGTGNLVKLSRTGGTRRYVRRRTNKFTRKHGKK
jgi:hypothetical protein